MYNRSSIIVLFTVCFSLLVAVTGISVLTQNVDTGRSGWNSQETQLTPGNVPQLQLLGTISTVSACTTQLLYYERLNLRGHTNVLFCVTNPDRNNGNTTVYAFDADSFEEIWALYVGQSALWATQAPVIDNVTNSLYFIYKNDDDNGYNYLVGIDIIAGRMLPDSPKFINASVPGTGAANVNGQIPFQNTEAIGSGKRIHNDCRTSLLVVNSVLFFGFAHNSDSFPYHGWVFAYRYDTGTQKFVQVAYYCVTPNADEGGVWQGGQGIASDGKSIWFTTGNGDFNINKQDMSMAVIKMSLQLELLDYFVPAKWQSYSSADLDLAGCGPTLIPNTHYQIVGVTKYGSVHLIDNDNMGKFQANQDSCRQSISLKTSYTVPGGNPVVWEPGTGAKVYVWAPSLDIIQFTYDPSTELLKTQYVGWGGDTNGGGLFITSNGQSDGVLWAYGRNSVYAFDATKDISSGPIWQASLNGPSSWGWPLVVNGKLYTNGGNSKISVFGLK